MLKEVSLLRHIALLNAAKATNFLTKLNKIGYKRL